MATSPTSPILIPGGLKGQEELAWKSIRAKFLQLEASIGSTSGDVALQRIAALQARINELQAEIDALSGGGTTKVYKAGTFLPAYVSVYELFTGVVGLVDPAVLASGNAIVGITLGSAAPGGDITVALPGSEVTNAAWAWTPLEPIFATTSGMLTQTQPDDGFVALVGYATSATTMFVYTGQPVFYGDGEATTLISQEPEGVLTRNRVAPDDAVDSWWSINTDGVPFALNQTGLAFGVLD